MSIIHTILPNDHFEFEPLNKRLSVEIENVVFEQRGEHLFYYWLDNLSVRGVDVSVEDEYIEIRNTLMSNRSDYLLTNEIIRAVADITDGLDFDEEENPVEPGCVYSNSFIDELVKDHCATVYTLSEDHGDIAIYGPMKIVHFGNHLFNTLKPFAGDPERLTDEMIRIALHIQYHLPAFKDGSLMEIGVGDDRKVMQIITNTESTIISKFDYVILSQQGETPIVLPNKILNGILPEKWKLIDEYTIVAEKLSEQEWAEFISVSLIHNQAGTILKENKQ
jgi:hypothetical protein